MSRKIFRLLFALILVLRVGLAAGFHGNFDTQSFLIVVAAVENGQNVYAARPIDTTTARRGPTW